MSGIHIEGVNKRFGETHAVRDLDLEVPQGSLCGFLGPNGAGKTTTIRMIMSIIRPDSGTVKVLGTDALRNKDRIGYLPEERGLYRKMRVGEFLAFMAQLKGVRRRGLADRIKHWLGRIELADVLNKRCDELSKGMQQKVQFVTAIIHEPELIVLDEPFSGLDPVNMDLLDGLISELRADGRTIVFSTHVLHQAEQICDRFFLIHQGQKILDATLDEVRTRFDPRTIRMELLDPEGDPGTIPGVASAAPLEYRGEWELHLREDAEPGEVMRHVAAHHAVRLVELRRVRLDEVFRRLVRNEGA